MIFFGGKERLGHAQIGPFRGLIQNFRRPSPPFHMGVPPGGYVVYDIGHLHCIYH